MLRTIEHNMNIESINRRRFFQCSAALSATAIPFWASRSAALDSPPAQFMENTCGSIQLANGRKLAYAEYGDPAAKQIIIHHHGFSSCRLDLKGLCCELMARPGVRMYSIDRPGIGQSSCDPCGNFLTWPADLEEFVNALHLDRFAISGASGGAPYALAAARALANRVTNVALLCPMAPLEAVGAADSAGARGALLAQKHPIAARMALNQSLAVLRRNPNRIPGALFT